MGPYAEAIPGSKEEYMKLRKKLRWSLPLFVMGFVLLNSSFLYAESFKAFDAKKVKLLTGAEKKNKADVVKLFGKADTSAPVQKTEEGCIELWIYTKVVMAGLVPEKTEILYVGFNDDGFVCSAEVKIVKPK
jgi:hypothetical protein